MPSTLSNLLFHVVFHTKNNKKLITSFKTELYKYITGIVKGEGGQLISICGMPDHVHIARKLPPVLSVSQIMKKIKGNSSKWINDHKKVVGHFSWQAGFGAFTVSKSRIGFVISYIKTQEQHHKKRTFRDEYKALLKKHNISYDERYLWD